MSCSYCILIATCPYKDVIKKCLHQHIDAVVVIGDQQPKIALLIFVKSTLDYSISDEAVRNALWDTVAKEFLEFFAVCVG